MRQNDPFRNSELDRAKIKRHIFHTFINDKLKRHRSDTGLVEDRTSSVTIVRIIVGLLMIHLIIIGGVLLRGKMVKDGGAGLATPVSITPPPPAPPVARVETPASDALPQPSAPAVAAAPTTAQTNHITQAGTDAAEEDAVDPEDEPVLVTPNIASTEPKIIRHQVARGDSWLRIAAQYGTTESALKAANPQAARGTLHPGVSLIIPQGESTAAAPARRPQTASVRTAGNPAAQAAAVAKTYVVQSGDTLSAIARKTGVSVNTLQEINNIKNPRRIHPGMQLRLSR